MLPGPDDSGGTRRLRSGLCKYGLSRARGMRDNLAFQRPLPEGTTMIARTWHGRVMTEKADSYMGYLKRTGLSDFRSTPGNMGVYVLRRDEGGITHFMVTTLWSSMDAIKSFAGENPDRARYYPQDDEFLLEREPLVTHYDVLMAVTGPPTG